MEVFLCHFYSSMSKLRTREVCLQLFHPLSQSMWSVTSSPLSLWTPPTLPACHLLSRQDPVYTMSTPQMLTQGQVFCQSSINNDEGFNYYSLWIYYLMILSLFNRVHSMLLLIPSLEMTEHQICSTSIPHQEWSLHSPRACSQTLILCTL